jgi:hypothetical protein
MAQQTYYRQCVLTQDLGEGATKQITTWIPEKGNGIQVEEGVSLRIKEHGSDDYQEGRWTVASVGTQRQEESRVKERAHNWTKYRSATDI